jgi:hypothetical protein
MKMISPRAYGPAGPGACSSFILGPAHGEPFPNVSPTIFAFKLIPPAISGNALPASLSRLRGKPRAVKVISICLYNRGGNPYYCLPVLIQPSVEDWSHERVEHRICGAASRNYMRLPRRLSSMPEPPFPDAFSDSLKSDFPSPLVDFQGEDCEER